MQPFSFEKTNLKDLMVINPFTMEDNRGEFVKYFERDTYRLNGINIDLFNETFESVSKKGVVRGLHFQEDNPQCKVVRVSYGEILDVVVDLRKESNTFSQYYKIKLSSKNKKVLFVPKGFAHGFIALSDIAIVNYSCDEKYEADKDSGLYWNDKALGIDWEIKDTDNIIISDKDRALQSFEVYCKKHNVLGGINNVSS